MFLSNRTHPASTPDTCVHRHHHSLMWSTICSSAGMTRADCPSVRGLRSTKVGFSMMQAMLFCVMVRDYCCIEYIKSSSHAELGKANATEEAVTVCCIIIACLSAHIHVAADDACARPLRVLLRRRNSRSQVPIRILRDSSCDVVCAMIADAATTVMMCGRRTDARDGPSTTPRALPRSVT